MTFHIKNYGKLGEVRKVGIRKHNPNDFISSDKNLNNFIEMYKPYNNHLKICEVRKVLDLELPNDGVFKLFKKSYVYECENHNIFEVKIEPKIEEVFITKGKFLEIIPQLLNQRNIFYSIHSFNSKCGKNENLKSIKGFCIDIDFKDNKLSEKEIIKIVLEQRVKPSFIAKTGNGIHLHLLLDEPYEVSQNNINEFENIYNSLIKKYEEKGVIADKNCRGIGGVFRLINTKNYKPLENKGEKEVGLIYKDLNYRTNLKDLNSYLGIKKLEKEIKKKHLVGLKPIKSNPNFNQFTLIRGRISDYKTIINLKNNKGEYEGYRDNLLFYYSLDLMELDRKRDKLQGMLIYLDEIFEVNELFRKGLTKSEVRGIVRYVYNRCIGEKVRLRKGKKEKYLEAKFKDNKLSSSTIIEKLNLKDEDFKNLKIIISKKEKEFRKNEKIKIKNLKKAEKEKDREKLISKEKRKFKNNMKKDKLNDKEYIAEYKKRAILKLSTSLAGFTQKEIALICDCSQQYVNSVLSESRE